MLECAFLNDDAILDDGDAVLRNFRFHNGESLSEVRIRYATLGQPGSMPVLDSSACRAWALARIMLPFDSRPDS